MRETAGLCSVSIPPQIPPAAELVHIGTLQSEPWSGWLDTGRMDPAAQLRHVGGVAPVRTLRQRGVSRRAMDHAISTGQVLKVRRGILAIPGAPSDFVSAVSHNGRLSCVSAASHFGLWCLDSPEMLHLSCPDGGSGTHVNHRPLSVPPHPYLPLVGLGDALLHVLRCLPLHEAVVMVESAFRRGDMALSFLFDRLDGDRNGKAREALRRVTGCAESPIEVVARLLFVAAGFHVETQVSIEGVGRVDFLLDGFLVVEIDGAAFHSDRKALRRDHRRNNATLLNGYLILRYGYEDVMFEQEAMLDQIRLALRRGRPHGR